MKNKKLIPVILISVVLLGIAAALLLFRPDATHVDVKMTGALYRAEKVAKDPVHITVQGTILNDKEVDFNFLQSGFDNWVFTKSSTSDPRLDQRLDTPYIISSCAFYKATDDRMVTAYYAFSAKDQMLLIYMMDDSQTVIACSANGEKTLSEIEEYFSVFVEEFSSRYE